eukprot:COSAG02_NODE_2559_length_8529_cov_5.446382_1_plen_65_part_00
MGCLPQSLPLRFLALETLFDAAPAAGRARARARVRDCLEFPPWLQDLLSLEKRCGLKMGLLRVS